MIRRLLAWMRRRPSEPRDLAAEERIRRRAQQARYAAQARDAETEAYIESLRDRWN